MRVGTHLSDFVWDGKDQYGDQLANGVMLPTTSVDQYAYTLGKWMGVSQSDLQSILPNLSQFNASTHDLGFMQA